MSIFPIYSRSVEVMRDVYVYDQIPGQLRNQISLIWGDFFQQFRLELRHSIFQKVLEIISHEHGLLNFSDVFLPAPDKFDRIIVYFNGLKDVTLTLDVIQILFSIIEESRDYCKSLLAPGLPAASLKYQPQDAIQSLNDRFRLSGIGYKYENGKIIRVSNDLLHEGTVRQTLLLTSSPEYKNVNHQYIRAHEHFSKGAYRDCLIWCLMAFESSIKIIAEKNVWVFEEHWSARRLIKLIFEHNYFPLHREISLNALRGLMEQSLLPIRNKQGPHGEGRKTVVVPAYLANFMLYETGATIRLMIETQQEREKAL